MKTKKKILDVCCGGRMFWFDKKQKDTLFLDKRTLDPEIMSNGATFSVKPDMIMDFRNLKFADDTFFLVVFDPPHVMRSGEKSFLAKKYGFLDKQSWSTDLRKGFEECFRVLKPNGTLVFKWNECHIPLKEILALTSQKPLFGNRGGKAAKTHWVVFIKNVI